MLPINHSRRSSSAPTSPTLPKNEDTAPLPRTSSTPALWTRSAMTPQLAGLPTPVSPPIPLAHTSSNSPAETVLSRPAEDLTPIRIKVILPPSEVIKISFDKFKQFLDQLNLTTAFTPKLRPDFLFTPATWRKALIVTIEQKLPPLLPEEQGNPEFTNFLQYYDQNIYQDISQQIIKELLIIPQQKTTTKKIKTDFLELFWHLTHTLIDLHSESKTEIKKKNLELLMQHIKYEVLKNMRRGLLIPTEVLKLLNFLARDHLLSRPEDNQQILELLKNDPQLTAEQKESFTNDLIVKNLFFTDTYHSIFWHQDICLNDPENTDKTAKNEYFQKLNKYTEQHFKLQAIYVKIDALLPDTAVIVTPIRKILSNLQDHLKDFSINQEQLKKSFSEVLNSPAPSLIHKAQFLTYLHNFSSMLLHCAFYNKPEDLAQLYQLNVKIGLAAYAILQKIPDIYYQEAAVKDTQKTNPPEHPAPKLNTYKQRFIETITENFSRMNSIYIRILEQSASEPDTLILALIAQQFTIDESANSLKSYQDHLNVYATKRYNKNVDSIYTSLLAKYYQLLKDTESPSTSLENKPSAMEIEKAINCCLSFLKSSKKFHTDYGRRSSADRHQDWPSFLEEKINENFIKILYEQVIPEETRKSFLQILTSYAPETYALLAAKFSQKCFLQEKTSAEDQISKWQLISLWQIAAIKFIDFHYAKTSNPMTTKEQYTQKIHLMMLTKSIYINWGIYLATNQIKTLTDLPFAGAFNKMAIKIFKGSYIYANPENEILTAEPAFHLLEKEPYFKALLEIGEITPLNLGLAQPLSSKEEALEIYKPFREMASTIQEKCGFFYNSAKNLKEEIQKIKQVFSKSKGQTHEDRLKAIEAFKSLNAQSEIDELSNIDSLDIFWNFSILFYAYLLTPPQGDLKLYKEDLKLHIEIYTCLALSLFAMYRSLQYLTEKEVNMIYQTDIYTNLQAFLLKGFLWLNIWQTKSMFEYYDFIASPKSTSPLDEALLKTIDQNLKLNVLFIHIIEIIRTIIKGKAQWSKELHALLEITGEIKPTSMANSLTKNLSLQKRIASILTPLQITEPKKRNPDNSSIDTYTTFAKALAPLIEQQEKAKKEKRQRILAAIQKKQSKTLEIYPPETSEQEGQKAAPAKTTKKTPAQSLEDANTKQIKGFIKELTNDKQLTFFKFNDVLTKMVAYLNFQELENDNLSKQQINLFFSNLNLVIEFILEHLKEKVLKKIASSQEVIKSLVKDKGPEVLELNANEVLGKLKERVQKISTNLNLTIYLKGIVYDLLNDIPNSIINKLEDNNPQKEVKEFILATKIADIEKEIIKLSKSIPVDLVKEWEITITTLQEKKQQEIQRIKDRTHKIESILEARAKNSAQNPRQAASAPKRYQPTNRPTLRQEKRLLEQLLAKAEQELVDSQKAQSFVSTTLLTPAPAHQQLKASSSPNARPRRPRASSVDHAKRPPLPTPLATTLELKTPQDISLLTHDLREIQEMLSSLTDAANQEVNSEDNLLEHQLKAYYYLRNSRDLNTDADE